MVLRREPPSRVPRFGTGLTGALSDEVIEPRGHHTQLVCGVEGSVVRCDRKFPASRSFSLRGMHNLLVLPDLGADFAISWPTTLAYSS
jgi:hypothetical protein